MRNEDQYSERVKGLGLSFTYLPKHESVQCEKCKTCKPAVTIKAGGSEKAGRIVIKGIQAGSPAAISDSLHVGDELVSISGRAIGKSF